jgi:dihydroorotase-like cyclic amidohydrolase
MIEHLPACPRSPRHQEYHAEMDARIRRLQRAREGQRRKYMNQCARRMRLELERGRSPQEILHQMKEEHRLHLQHLGEDRSAALISFMEDGIRAAEAESRLLTF